MCIKVLRILQDKYKVMTMIGIGGREGCYFLLRENSAITSKLVFELYYQSINQSY